MRRARKRCRGVTEGSDSGTRTLAPILYSDPGSSGVRDPSLGASGGRDPDGTCAWRVADGSSEHAEGGRVVEDEEALLASAIHKGLDPDSSPAKKCISRVGALFYLFLVMGPIYFLVIGDCPCLLPGD